MKPYPTLFSAWSGKRLQLKNRILHAAMTTRRVRDGQPTTDMIQYYANRAAGGAAAVITEPLDCARIQNRPHYVRAWNDSNIEALKRWAEAVEAHECRLLGQIQDSGRGRHERGRNPRAYGVSALADDLSWTVPHELTGAEIERMIEEFASSAARLERCGFSGIEISAGHGHLIHQFLSPWSNSRADRFGGDFEGRLRFLLEMLTSIRNACGALFIIGVKLPGHDGIPDSIGPVLAAQIATAVTSRADIDYVTFCQGTHARTLDWHIPDMHWSRRTWMSLIAQLKPAVGSVPLAALGLITDPAEAEGILIHGVAELVQIGRALITDPAWPRKAAEGRARDIRYCVSCNTCWGQIAEQQPLVCDNNPRVALADEVDWRPQRTERRRRIVVAGAGIAGLEAAWIAANRGHDVTVFGASAEVGGATRLQSLLPGGESLSSIYDYQFSKALEGGARFELGWEASVADVLDLDPDVVVTATGATMQWPRSFPQRWQDEAALEDLRKVSARLLTLKTSQAGTAVIFDMDHTEFVYAAAELFSSLFDRVFIVTPRDRIAADVPLVTALGIQRRLAIKSIQVVTLADVSALSDLERGLVRAQNIHTGNVTDIGDVALLTYATPRRPRSELEAQLLARGKEVWAVGDCYAPRTVLAATSDGHRVGNAL